MSLYNETELDNAQNIVEQAIAINNLTNGVLSVVVLVLMYIVVFIAVKQADTKASVVTTAFIMFIIGILGYGMGLITTAIILTQFALLIVALIFTIWRRE